MQFVPWGQVADWKCIACGQCCRLYRVVLNFHEWLRIVKYYGVEQTASSLNELFIRRKTDGSCVFLNSFPNTCACSLQNMKPKACQLWPFKILQYPKFGRSRHAAYQVGDSVFFVYVDPMCCGLKYGTPTWEFAYQTVGEFVELALGLRSSQLKTTASMSLPRPDMLGSYGVGRLRHEHL